MTGRKRRFPKIESDQWVQPVREDYLMKCCDCGLVHEMDFRLYGKNHKIQFRARRKNNREEKYSK